MKALDSLIRLHRWKADERRREMAQLEAMREDLLQRRMAIETDIAREQNGAEQAVVQFAYAAFLRGAMVRRETLARSITDIERVIEDKRAGLIEAVRELKKYEVAAARRAEQASVELERREQVANDEVALNVYRQHN